MDNIDFCRKRTSDRGSGRHCSRRKDAWQKDRAWLHVPKRGENFVITHTRVKYYMTNCNAHFVFSSSGSFGANTSSDKDAVLPAQGFVNQRDTSRSSAAKKDGVDRHSFRIFPCRIDDRALAGRCTKSSRTLALVIDSLKVRCIAIGHIQTSNSDVRQVNCCSCSN